MGNSLITPDPADPLFNFARKKKAAPKGGLILFSEVLSKKFFEIVRRFFPI